MRTTLEIKIAVKEAEPEITDDELRLCVEAQGAISHFIRCELIKLVEAIREDKPIAVLKIKAEFAWGTLERMFQAQKIPPAEWLGPENIPGTLEQRKRMAWAKRVYEKAIGEKL